MSASGQHGHSHCAPAPCLTKAQRAGAVTALLTMVMVAFGLVARWTGYAGLWACFVCVFAGWLVVGGFATYFWIQEGD